MNKTIQLFLASKKESTAKAYSVALRQFLVYLKGKPPDEVEISDALAYLTAIRESHAAATVSSRQGALSAFYAYLVALNKSRLNPFQAVIPLLPRRQKKQVRPTKTLPEELIKRLLNLPCQNTKEGIRDRALLSALFGGGLRRSEAVAIRLSDIEVTPKGDLFLRLEDTKSGTTQMQPLRGEFAERVCLLVSQRKQEGAQNEDFLFVCYEKYGRPKKTLSVKTLYRMFRYYSKLAGLEAAPHAARAAAITKLLKDGVRLIDVQKFARHHSWHTVCIYDHRRLEIETAPSPNFFKKKDCQRGEVVSIIGQPEILTDKLISGTK